MTSLFSSMNRGQEEAVEAYEALERWRHGDQSEEAVIFYGSQNPDVSISLKYHESGMGFVGQLEFYKGQLFTNNYYEYGQCRTPEEVVQLIGADLDELFGITYGIEMEVED